MSENPFVNQLGDALEQAFAAGETRKPRAGRRVWWRRPAVIVAFAVVLLGCGAAVAKTLLNSTTLALNGVQCVEGTTLDDPLTDSPKPDYTKSPEQLCSKALGLPASKLIACARARDGYVFVFHAVGARQCRRLGLERLPASYPAAKQRVLRLELALTALAASKYCLSPAQFTAGATRILHRQGWRGWHVFAGNTPKDEVGLIGGGYCAVLDGSAYPNFHPDVSMDIDQQSKTVSYSLGPPPELTKLVGTLAVAIERRTASRCFSRKGLESSVAGLLASHQLGAAFANRAQTPGESLDQGPTLGLGGQARYERGCPVVMLVRTAAGNLHVADVLVNQRGAPAMPDHGLPPQSAFRTYAP
jgi:hypothetical protein